MTNTKKNFQIIVSVLVTGLLIYGGMQSHKNTEREIRIENEKVSSYTNTTIDRVKNSVVTLPEGDTIVGVKNGVGDFMLEGSFRKGRVKILSEYFITYFKPRESKTDKARLDLLIPMSVEGDSHGSSLYIILFEDRGDAVIEKSHVRLGGASVVVDTISVLPKDEKNPLEEYQVKITYFLEGMDRASSMLKIIPKEVIIPVADGHFVDEDAME